MIREIVMDTETTGLNPRSGDRLVEIGGIELINRMPTGEVLHEYINPERNMPQEAFEIHGLSSEFLADKPIFTDVAEKFLAFIGDATLVIHNASFDMGFINSELAATDRAPIPLDRVVDTLLIARRKFPGAANSLDALCKRFGVNNSARTRHGALLDSELLADVYLELLGERQAKLILGHASTLAGQTADAAKSAAAQRPSPLPQRLSSEELAAHEAFVASLGDQALWRRLGTET